MKLNLGCGNKRKEGFIGVDRYPCDAVDILANLEERLPFEADSVTEILLDNVIEHIQDIPSLMKELHRISRPGCEISIITPHFANMSSWVDPTHVHHLSYFSMEHFEKPEVAHYTGGGFKIKMKHLSFGGLLGNIGRFIFTINARIYEKSWCFIFRPSTLYFILKVQKLN